MSAVNTNKDLEVSLLLWISLLLLDTCNYEPGGDVYIATMHTHPHTRMLIIMLREVVSKDAESFLE